MERTRVRARGAAARTDGGKVPEDSQMENREAAALWYDFAKYGKVVDVYVPRKRDKWGKRFGFVRMAGVQNEAQMVKRLNEIWIGYYKMRVKIANKSQNRGARNTKLLTAANVKWTKVGMNRLVQPGHSYAQAVVGNSSAGEKVGAGPATATERAREVSEPVPVQAFRLVEKEEVGSSAKVVAKEALSSITSIQERMDVDGGLIVLSPLGGRSVLLIEWVRGYLTEYLLQNKETFDAWFDDIQPWRAAYVQRGRLAWLRISGVPLQAWNDRCFEMVGGTVGEVVRIHEDTRRKSILCDGKVLVLCSEAPKVSKTISLKVDEKMYEIDVVEEEWRSDPDWWLSEEDRQSSMSTASETHSMQSEDDGNELIINGISGEDDDSLDTEPLHNEDFLNARVQEVTACENQAELDLPREVREVNGYDIGEENDEGNGLVRGDVHNGLEESFGLSKGPTTEASKDKEEEPTGEALESSSIIQKEKYREGKGKRRRKVAECYPKELSESRTERVDWVTARTKKMKRKLNLDYVGWRKGMKGRVNIREGFREYAEEEGSAEIGAGSIGASGGLLCVWDRRNFSKLGQFTRDGYLGIKGLWGEKKELCYLVNVYAPNDRKKKAELWDELRQMIMEEGGRWLIAGDFNAVRSIEERRGKTGESPEMKEFNDFIEAVGLVDYKLANRRFTWYRPDGTAMSWLDRVLMTIEMTELGGEWVQQGLKRTISDHCAIVMKTKVTD
ncbi:hypothetical protein SLEP1_g57366 [Rubroshorea leprosula]|uniref:Endonuclease/exonuclease/phosphatase domain-containing protein n=1 Tax=Rubroshorea leprosula TaxID=152421 RepID=A0AAV5MMQ6_9ROSI|nr:hypothetical protein SLEP1_g57366 [Rubroshorea leprosula]